MTFAQSKDREIHICLGIVFVAISFLVLTTYQWKPDFSNNIWTIRIWQYLLALFGGGALGVAGLLLQKLTRNHLADVSILGVGSLNVVFVILFIICFHDGTIARSVSVCNWLPIVSSCASVLGFCCIYKLSKKGGNKFLIVGLSMQFLFEAISVILINPKLVNNSSKINNEIQNYAYGRFPNIYELASHSNWRNVTFLSILSIMLIIAIAFSLRKQIDLLSVGSDFAKSKGVNVTVITFVVFMCVALLAGIEASMLGTISLLGIIAPNLSKMIFTHNSTNVFTSFIIGGTLVLFATFISINIDQNIPIGLLSVALISPVFIYLIFQ